MPRRHGDGYWLVDNLPVYHVARRNIRLAKVMGIGDVEFQPILEKLYREIDDGRGPVHQRMDDVNNSEMPEVSWLRGGKDMGE